MTYYIYHIPGKKIGVTRDLKNRVEKQQGYGPSEYDVIMKSDNIDYISEQEIYLQEMYGYRIDDEPYNELKFNNTNMNINITEQTTTFPCPVNKLKGQLMDNIDMKEHDTFTFDTPCTYAIQFTIVHNKLDMCITMRSNDLWYGFCNDQYQFSKLQEMVSKRLKIETGAYYHFAHNMHLYNDKI